MKKSHFTVAAICLMLLKVQPVVAQHDHAHHAEIVSPPQNLSYIANEGQWQDNILFRADLGSGSVFLEQGALTFSQLSTVDLETRHAYHHDNPEALKTLIIHGHAWKTNFIGAHPDALVTGNDLRPEYHNYFIGNDPQKWAGNVPAFNGVGYQHLYDSIDLNIYSHEGNLKYDFVIRPSGDPAEIQLNYEGIDELKLVNGTLLLKTSIGDFIESAPYAYQVDQGQKITVPCNYVLNGKTISFHFPEGYDPDKELIIDPVLVAATLSGTLGGTNYGHCATYDEEGNIYTGGINFGSGYPQTPGAFQMTFAGGFLDMVFSKANPNATALIYATHMGGQGSEYPHSMIVNANGELFVMGSTTSDDFPVTTSAYSTVLNGPSDIVTCRFNAAGSMLIGSSYIGGSWGDGNNNVTTNYGDMYRGEIILDNFGNSYIACTSSSFDFPVTPGAYQTFLGGTSDAVFFSFNSNMSVLNWSTYLGGPGDESGLGLRLDDQGHVYACGATTQNFIAATGYQPSFQGMTDGFVVELTNNGTTIPRSTYWGTPSTDNTFFLDIDDEGFIYIYGQSDGGSSVVTPGVYSNPSSGQYIAKLDSTLNNLEFGTVIGNGNATEFVPIAFMVDHCGYIYFSGHSAETGMPLGTSPIQSSGGFYLGVLTPDATNLHYATYYGGQADHVDGGTSRFDPNGIIYQGVCTIMGFNTTPGAYGFFPSGGWDLAVFKIDFEVSPMQALATAHPSDTGCVPFEVTFDNNSNGISYAWDFDDGSPVSTAFEPTHTFTVPGSYEVMLIAYDPTACNQSDTTYVSIVVQNSESAHAQISYDADCATGEVTVSNAGSTGESFIWDMGDGTTYSGPTATHIYTTAGTYTITLTAENSVCATPDVAAVDIAISTPAMTVIHNDPVCYQFSDGSLTLFVNSTTGSETYTIQDAAGNTLNVAGSNTANNLPAGWYYYTIDLGNGCISSDSLQLINPQPLAALLTISNPLCYGEATGIVIVDTVLNWQGSYDNLVYSWNPNPGGVSGIGADTATNYPAGAYVLTVNDQNGCTNTFDFIVTHPDPLIFSEMGTDPAYCRLYDFQSGNGVVYASASGGTPDYAYLWTNLQTGATTANTTWGGLNPGFYQITATDDNGCIITNTVEVINVDPIADFTMVSPAFNTLYEGTVPVTVTFTNQSLFYLNPNDPVATATFLWNFNSPDGPWVISHDINEIFDTTYLHAGVYNICLVALNQNGCSDTACAEIIVHDNLLFEPINVFTPDGDGINDEFTFVFRSDAVKIFKCIIVNRWGVTIAEFDHITDTWNGRDANGDLCPDGVYFYAYEGEADNGEAFKGQGSATLIHSKK